jgi:hypothetical protein
VVPIEKKLVQHHLRWFGDIQWKPRRHRFLSGVISREEACAGEVQVLDHLLHSVTTFTALCQPTPLSPLSVTIWYQIAWVRPPCHLLGLGEGNNDFHRRHGQALHRHGGGDQATAAPDRRCEETGGASHRPRAATTCP